MIRPLTVDDLDQFIVIRRESFAKAPLSFAQEPDVEIDREQTRKDLAAKHDADFILGYFEPETNELLATVGFYRYTPSKRAHRGFLWGVYVNEKMRGQGLALRMMQECIRRCRAVKGLERIILTVSHQAPAAVRLYEKLGFVVFGREPGAAKTGDTPMDEIYMLLDL